MIFITKSNAVKISVLINPLNPEKKLRVHQNSTCTQSYLRYKKYGAELIQIDKLYLATSH